MDAATTDACLSILDASGLRGPVMERILNAVQSHLTHRAADTYEVGAVLFSNEFGLLGSTDYAKEILKRWRKE